jgi:hypothetical protein
LLLRRELRVLRPRSDREAGTRGFWLYVEGPRDQEVLRGWASACAPALLNVIESSAVILGGRQPARAAEHFRRMGAPGASLRGLCVLDRDATLAVQAQDAAEGVPGLAVFTWSRRHIESYLLAPDAIRRGLRLARDDLRIERILRAALPDPADERAWRDVDAKRLLGRNGPVARALGRSVPLGRIARGMRDGEIHPDVHRLFAAVREALASAQGAPGLAG